MKKNIFLTMIVILMTTSLFAQEFGLSGELRPRFEYRHGYKTLASPNVDGASFVSQRTRLNANYSNEKFKVYFSIQNVRVWGDVSTLASSDNNGITFHQAWAEYFFTPKFSVKLGRQEIAYDDQRMFGSVGWAQQARSHDAMIVKFKTGEKGKLDIGFALNANKETLFKENYAINQYKTFQYAWYHTNFSDAFGLSLLALNNGMEYETDKLKIAYSQTLGGRLTYNKNRLSADGSAYIQTGSLPNSVDLSAYYVSGNAKFKITDEFKAGIGIEILSGDDQDSSPSKDNAFKPLYGTNHKFNGWMDYFYVGSYMNSVGLIDISMPLIYKKDKFSAVLIPHFFSAESNVFDGTTKMDNRLGTEIDLNLGYKFQKNVMFNVGYSHMIATDTMELLKNGSKNETNNWAWVMITFKPNFFSKKN